MIHVKNRGCLIAPPVTLKHIDKTYPIMASLRADAWPIENKNFVELFATSLKPLADKLWDKNAATRRSVRVLLSS